MYKKYNYFLCFDMFCRGLSNVGYMNIFKQKYQLLNNINNMIEKIE